MLFFRNSFLLITWVGDQATHDKNNALFQFGGHETYRAAIRNSIARRVGSKGTQPRMDQKGE
jgi:hypothetical protein